MQRWFKSIDEYIESVKMTKVLRDGRDTTRPREASDVSGIAESSILLRRGAFEKKSRSRVTDISPSPTWWSVKAVRFGRFCQGIWRVTPARVNLHNDDKSPLKSFALRVGGDLH